MAKRTQPTSAGWLIAERMDALGISSEQLAERMDVDIATVNRWRKGVTKAPAPKQLARLCVELQIWPNVLMNAMYPAEMAELAREMGIQSHAAVEATLAGIPEFQGLLSELAALDPETLRALMLLARKAAGK